MEFGVLGPLLARDAGRSLILASAKQRTLLAALLLQAPSDVVSAERLIDELWGEDPPATAIKSLQVHVSQLRRALGPRQPIITRPTGYTIHIDRAAFDLHRFQDLLAHGRQLRAAGSPAAALSALREALGQWRGPALMDVTLLGPRASARDRLQDLHAAAREERLELEVEQGDSAALLPELEALIATDPYRERVHGLLMRALYRAGRQADALEAFRRARALMVGDLGLEPGPDLVRLEAAILAQDPALERPAPIVVGSVTRPGFIAIHDGTPPVGVSLLGRDAELRAALALIQRPDVRLVTLTGAGGIGKTRLALELATRLRPHGRFVELAAIADPDRVIPAIGAAVGAESGSAEAVAAALRRTPVVLFLDNLEQVLGAAPAIAALLSAVASLTAVVTSRAPLRVTGEHELPVPPLDRDAAVELFVSRAREQDQRFSPDTDDRESIAAICARIDRLPLAIELAAARIRVLTPNEILDRIGRRLDLLTAGRRDAPQRHRTLRTTISWSHDLLDGDEQRLFAQLAVFPSGWSLEAGEAVAAGPSLDALSALVDHCLVIRDGSRFRMPETVHEYAAERLEALPDAKAVGRRHALWYLALAEVAEQELEGPQQAAWFARLDAEQANLRTAASWGVANGEPKITLGLDGALWRYWLARGAVAEARGELTAALTSGQGHAALRTKALTAAGVLAGEAGDFPAARAAFLEALELASQLSDRPQMALALMHLGNTAVFTEEYVSALARYAEAGDIWRELGDLRGQSDTRQNLAILHGLMGNVEQALPLLDQSVTLAREAGDELRVASTLIELAKQLVEHRLGDPRIPALLREGMKLSTALGERGLIVECLEVVAALSAGRGAPVAGAQLIGAADAERERAGLRHTPDQRPFFDTTARALKRALGRETYGRELERGHGLGLEAAVAVALESAAHHRAPA